MQSKSLVLVMSQQHIVHLNVFELLLISFGQVLQSDNIIRAAAPDKLQFAYAKTKMHLLAKSEILSFCFR